MNFELQIVTKNVKETIKELKTIDSVKAIRVILGNGQVIALVSGVNINDITISEVVEKIKRLNCVTAIKIIKKIPDNYYTGPVFKRKKRRSAWGPDWEG